MSSIASYSFLPWLRQGVANTIASADGDPSVTSRAQVNVSVQLSGDPVGGGAELTQTVAQDVALYGPGDIVGIDGRAVLRTEPRDWITNFESNYLPAIDFYDEDLPWRYTPAAPDASALKLRPWIALIVLGEAEFDPGQTGAERPLPYVSVADASVFPPADELWAWAHVHFNESLAGSASELVSADLSAVLPRVETILAANPDSAYSRLLCPRRLEADTAYHAFVIPTFETGRLAGLGLDPAGAPHATHSAWADYAGRPESTNYPFYLTLVLPHRLDRRLRVPRPPAEAAAGRRARRRSATWTCRIRARTFPASPSRPRTGSCDSAAPCRFPTLDLNQEQQDERNRYENWDQPYPTAVPEGARRLRRPARRLRRRRPRPRRTRQPGSDPASATIPTR